MVTTVSVMVASGPHNYSMDAYLPSTAGARPVVVLAPGTQQPGKAYQVYGQRLASYGIVTLIRDDPGVLTNTRDVVADLEYLVDTWLAAENARAGSMLLGRLDTTKVGLAGHSRGGKASIMVAAMAPKGDVKAWVGLDPTDAEFMPSGLSARAAIGSVGMPTLFLGAQVVSNCAPAAGNYQMLFDASSAPSVALTLVGAGHIQLEEASACAACSFCSPDGTADAAATLARAVHYLTALFARELLGDASVGPGLDGAGLAVDVAAGAITRSMK
jgi:pimeloyl-ACP methyl ester carboxylesterase